MRSSTEICEEFGRALDGCADPAERAAMLLRWSRRLVANGMEMAAEAARGELVDLQLPDICSRIDVMLRTREAVAQLIERQAKRMRAAGERAPGSGFEPRGRRE